jgi:hypothetical protein
MGMMDAESRPCFGKPIQRHARMGSMGRMFLVFLSMVCSMLHREDFRCSYMSDDPAHRARTKDLPGWDAAAAGEAQEAALAYMTIAELISWEPKQVDAKVDTIVCCSERWR